MVSTFFGTLRGLDKAGTMNLKRVNIELDVSEVQEVVAIELDESPMEDAQC